MQNIRFLILIFYVSLHAIQGQNISELDEMKQKSNEFTKIVMSEGASLHDKLPMDLVPMNIYDFQLTGEDSLTMVRINAKFKEYYDYLLDYQSRNGFSTHQLSTLFIDSAKDALDGESMSCFDEWYKRDVHTISMTLACYESEIESIKEACTSRSIQYTIINNASVAECIKLRGSK